MLPALLMHPFSNCTDTNPSQIFNTTQALHSNLLSLQGLTNQPYVKELMDNSRGRGNVGGETRGLSILIKEQYLVLQSCLANT